MTIAGRQYNEAELREMQREAEARVRDMQRRARETVEDDAPPRQRGWNQNPGMRRYPPHGSGRRPPPPPEPEQQTPEPEAPPASPDAPTEPSKTGTLLGDIMGSLGLDEDYLLIIGLILILVNQRADTTLILALAYLLI
jgi:hypothetical protein